MTRGALNRLSVMEWLDGLLQRPVVVSLAVAGAGLATIGSFLMRKHSRCPVRVARAVLRTGYAVSGLSVVIFIILGFRAR